MKPLKDYSFVKGVNYGVKEETRVRRDLGYGKRLGVNSVRVWLSYLDYEADPEGYVQKLVNFVRVCDSEGVTVVPILFNGNGVRPATLEEDFIPRGEAYAAAVIAALKDEPGLIMWDVMNEPPCNDLILGAKTKEEADGWYAKIWKFVRYFCKFTKEQDPVNAITVGNWLAEHIEATADLVDVIAYHDYSSTLKGVREAAELAIAMGKKYDKPVINNETCCIARSNPYDLVLQVLEEYKIPWYVFELMIEGYWNDVHGIFYPDGTVRDPAIAAAMLGCYRNRDINTIVPEKANREKQAKQALEKLDALLSDSHANVFAYGGMQADELLEVCEHMANLLEAGELVSMQIPPTAKIYAWRKQEKPNMLAIKKFAYELAQILKKGCQIL